jgi:hypothetical protein
VRKERHRIAISFYSVNKGFTSDNSEEAIGQLEAA